MSIMDYNGAAVLAMKGKNCVAIACDRRFGVQGQTIGMNFEKIFEMGPTLFLGLTGLATDIQTVAERLKFRISLYELRENRRIKPKTLTSVISNFLYEHRFGTYFVEPIIAGLDRVTGEPYVATLDLIGCITDPDDFVVSGTCKEQLYGMCESLYVPDMDPERLFQVVSQALLNAVDRDAMSGWGAVVHIIEKDKITTRTLGARMD